MAETEGQIDKKRKLTKEVGKKPAEPNKPAEPKADDPPKIPSEAEIMKNLDEVSNLLSETSPEDNPFLPSSDSTTSKIARGVTGKVLDAATEKADAAMGQARDDLASLGLSPREDLEMSAEQAGDYLSSLSMFPEETKQDSPDPMKALDTSLGKSYVDLGMKASSLDRASKRRGIASGLKDLSKRGALTPERLKEARQRAADAGVTEEEFDKFLQKSSLRMRRSPFSIKEQKKGTGLFDQPAPDPTKKAEATERVLYEREFGTEPLGMMKAMQDPDYVTGSYSKELFKSKPLSDRKSSFYKREAEKAERKGDRRLASRLREAAVMAKSSEPTIDTRELEAGRVRAQMDVASQARQQQETISEIMKRARESQARLDEARQKRTLR